MSSSSHSHKHTHHISTTTTKTPPTKGNANANTQACAACKYQRRKCASDCILAPYFPHDRQRQFLNAHKLFGVSNIKKIIKHLDQPDKDDAMRTIIFQSDVRANDPVGGCYRIICELQRLIEYNKAELDIVLHQLAICRAQAQEVYQQQHQNPIQMPEIGDQNACDPSIKVDPWSLHGNPMGHFYYIQQPQPPHHAVALQQEQPQQQQQRVPYVFVQNNTNSNNNSDSTNGDPHPYPHQHLYEDLSMWAMQDSVSCLDIKQCDGGMNGITNVCEDLKPFVDQIACDNHERNNGEVIDINGDHQQRFLVTNTELLMSS